MSMEAFDQSAFGQQVKQQRKARQLTQDELAEAAGVCRATVARVESGRGDSITLVVFCQLFHALNITPNALLGVRDTECLRS